MRRWRRTSFRVELALLLALALAVAATVVRAEPPAASADAPHIVLVTNHADAAIVPLLRAELETLGMHVEVEDRGPNEIVPRDLNVAARRHQAVAAVRVLVAAGVVEVWIADRVTGKIVLRDVIAESRERVDETLVAVRAVELLRGSLMELEAPHEPRGEIPAPPALRSLAQFLEDRERFALGVEGAALWSAGGATPAPAATLSLTFRPWRFGALRMAGGAALAPAKLSSVEGTAEFSLRWIELGAVAVLPPSESRLRGSLGAGFGLSALSMEGTPVGSYLGTSRTLWSPTPSIRASVGYAVARPVRIVLGVWAGRMLRHAEVQFAGRHVGAYGAWLACGSLGVEVTWP